MTIYSVDLHNHGLSRGKGGLFYSQPTPEGMVMEAHRKGISVFALSEKDEPLKTYHRIKKLGKELGMCILPAQEVRTVEGDVLGIGITEKVESSGKISCFEAAERIKELGGKALATHPGYPGTLSRKNVLELYKSGKIVGGDFVTGAVDYFLKSHHDRNLSWAEKNSIPCLGFSDAKTIKQVGTCTTLYDFDELDEEHVLKKIEYPSGIVRKPSLRSFVEKALQTYSLNRKGLKRLLLSDHDLGRD